MVQISFLSENVVLETLQKNAKGVHVAHVCRSMNRNGDLRVAWKDIRFVDGAFTTWPKGWGLRLRTTARVKRVLEEHSDLLASGQVVDLRVPGSSALTGILELATS